MALFAAASAPQDVIAAAGRTGRGIDPRVALRERQLTGQPVNAFSERGVVDTDCQ